MSGQGGADARTREEPDTHNAILLAPSPDSLIARDRGPAEALELRQSAGRVHQSEMDREEFDIWLREVGHARNPGTSEDLLKAVLFAWLRECLAAASVSLGSSDSGAPGGISWNPCTRDGKLPDR